MKENLDPTDSKPEFIRNQERPMKEIHRINQGHRMNTICAKCGLHLQKDNAVQDMQSVDLYWHVACLADALKITKKMECEF